MNYKFLRHNTTIFLVVFMFGTFSNIKAQIDVKGKLQEKINQRANDKVDQAIDKGLDKTEEGVKKSTQKKDKPANAEQKDEKNAPDNNQGEVNNNSDNNTPTKPTSKEDPMKLYSKFDFTPGIDIIFFDDFSQDNLDEYPLNWLTNGRGEVMSLAKYPNAKWFRMNNEGTNCTEKKVNFTENTTIEFDLIPYVGENTENSLSSMDFTIYTQSDGEYIGDAVPGKAGFRISSSDELIDCYSWIDGQPTTTRASSKTLEFVNNKNQKVHISIWVQKRRMRFYVNQDKVIDLPTLIPQGYQFDRICFYSSPYNENFSLLISNLKVAVGTPDTRNKLVTEGKFVTNGIKFDSGSDKIKPESYAVIKEIATVLTENPSINIKIIGHTDSDGDDATNLDLSKKRAIAVKNMLNKDFSIDLNRIQTDGKGESSPVSPNTTPEGKASNRRVEFIKL